MLSINHGAHGETETVNICIIFLSALRALRGSKSISYGTDIFKVR